MKGRKLHQTSDEGFDTVMVGLKVNRRDTTDTDTDTETEVTYSSRPLMLCALKVDTAGEQKRQTYG